MDATQGTRFEAASSATAGRGRALSPILDNNTVIQIDHDPDGTLLHDQSGGAAKFDGDLASLHNQNISIVLEEKLCCWSQAVLLFYDSHLHSPHIYETSKI